MRSAAFLPALALAAIVPAQTLVIPAGKSLATSEGNSNSLTPGNPSVARVQFVYAKSVMGGSIRPIVGMRWRPDGLYSSYRPWPAFTALNFSVWVGPHPGPLEMDRHSHAGNRGPAHTLVVNPRKLAYPATPKPATAPDKFTMDIKFDKPFVYPNQSGLVVEMARDDGAYKYYRWYMDAHNDGANARAPQGRSTVYGNGCPTTFTVTCHRVAVSGNTKNPEAPFPGQTFFTQGSCGQPAIPVVGLLGASDKTYAGLPLPFSLTPLGAPGCNLYTDILLVTSCMSGTGATGDYKLGWGRIPFDQVLAGLDLYHQVAGISSSYNSLGAGFSNGLKVTLGPGYSPGLEVGCVYGNYYSAFPAYSLSDDVPQFWKPKAAVLEIY